MMMMQSQLTQFKPKATIMKSLLLVLVLTLVPTALSMAITKSPPVLSESFSAKYQREESANMHPYDITSTGVMKIDYENKRKMSTIVYSYFKDHTWYLDLYEPKIAYTIHWFGNESTPNGTCSSATIDWSLPTNWDWVNETVFSHTEMYKNKYKVDVFMSKGATPENGKTIAVGHDNPQIVYYTREVINNNFRTNYDYEDFNPSAPDPSVFIPPKECHKP